VDVQKLGVVSSSVKRRKSGSESEGSEDNQSDEENDDDFKVSPFTGIV